MAAKTRRIMPPAAKTALSLGMACKVFRPIKIVFACLIVLDFKIPIMRETIENGA